MLLAVSTAGDSIGCFLDERVELLKKVLNKTIKDVQKYDRYFIYLCTAPRDNKGNFLNPMTNEILTEIDDPILIEAVNPSANETVSLDLLVNDAKSHLIVTKAHETNLKTNIECVHNIKS